MTLLQDRPAAASTPVDSVDADGRFDVATAIREALAVSDLSCKAAAFVMDLDPAQFSRQLHGDGHIPLDRIIQLPPDTQRAFVQRWAEWLGLRVVSRDLTRANLQRLMHAMVDCLAALDDAR